MANFPSKGSSHVHESKIASNLGNPYLPVEKSKWTAASSGYYKNSNNWKPSDAVDGKHNTLYATSTYDIYHWIQVDFGKTVSVSLD